MMNSDIVSIKGIKDGLLVTLSPTEDWLMITKELAARLDEKTEFFAGARVTVELGERPVPKYELSSLKALLERRKLILVVVSSSSNTSIESAHALDLRTLMPEALRPKNDFDDDAMPIDPEEQGTLGVLIKRTLRSGRTVHSRGHVVIFGDVNPGAKIVATGDIIIWGRLRGTVHAGAEGDTSAVVCALDMSPNQLRIAEYIATSPQNQQRKGIEPEIASVKDAQLVVEVWKP